jgi:hypothetical protein
MHFLRRNALCVLHIEHLSSKCLLLCRNICLVAVDSHKCYFCGVVYKTKKLLNCLLPNKSTCCTRDKTAEPKTQNRCEAFLCNFPRSVKQSWNTPVFWGVPRRSTVPGVMNEPVALIFKDSRYTKNAIECPTTQYHVQENRNSRLHRHRNLETRKTDLIGSRNKRVPGDHGPLGVGLQCFWDLSMSRKTVIPKLFVQHIYYDNLLPATHLAQRNLSL